MPFGVCTQLTSLALQGGHIWRKKVWHDPGFVVYMHMHIYKVGTRGVSASNKSPLVSLGGLTNEIQMYLRFNV